MYFVVGMVGGGRARARVDPDSGDDVRVGGHRGRQPLATVMSRAEWETRAGADVDEGAVRPTIIDLKEWIVEGVSDEPVRVAIRVLSVENRRGAARLEDRTHVAEVQIDQRGDRD